MTHWNNPTTAPPTPHTNIRRPRGARAWVRHLILRLFRSLGFDLVRRGPGFDLAEALVELDHHRAFRPAAETEIRTLKERVESQKDQLRVTQDYLSALQAMVTVEDASAPPPTKYPSCPWIEGGLSFIPGRLRVCPNSHLGGGTPGLTQFSMGRLPVEEILSRRDIIRRANRSGAFSPCTRCAFRVERNWEPKPYTVDLLCIAHATACNLACGYCHSIPEERYLQNPNSVPRLYSTFQALINDGHLAPESRIQWGGGEPTILHEFELLFDLFRKHGAYSEVYTSGVRVPPVLLDALAQDRAGVMISLDAGRPETYARIKGRPLFDRVVANTARYVQANPGRTILKMILSEQNLDEVSRFLDIAERTGVRIVCHDTMMYREHIDDRVIEASARFREESTRRGLECRIGEVGSVFNPDDRVAGRIEDIRRSLAELKPGPWGESQYAHATCTSFQA